MMGIMRRAHLRSASSRDARYPAAGRLDATLIRPLRIGLGVVGALYSLAVVLELLGARPIPPGETASAVLCSVGAAATLLRRDIGRRLALLCAFGGVTLSVAFHTEIAAQVWALLPAQALAVYLRSVLPRWHARTLIAVLCALLVAALSLAPAPVPPEWLVIFPLVVIGLAETMGTLQSMLIRIAMTDPLSGLRNRVGLEVDASRLLGGPPLGVPVAVAVIDIVGMKEINDRRGHLAGDSALVEVANTLAAVAPPGGTTARIGGDEFLMIARTDAVTLRSSVDAAQAGLAVQVTGGVAEGTTGTSELLDLIRAADADLYRRRELIAARRGVALPSTGA